MNIGIVTTWFERGAAYVSKAYAEVLASRHDIFIFARGGEYVETKNSNWKHKNLKIATRNKYGTTEISLLEYKKWIDTNEIELVIFNEQADWEVVLYSRLLKVKTAAYIDYYQQDTIEYFDLYDAVICNTKRHSMAFENHQQSFFIPWGTDTKLFNYNPASIDNDGIKFFHSAGMGGVRGRKGTDLLLKSFKNVTGNCKLILHSQVPQDAFSFSELDIYSDPRVVFIEKTVPAPGLYHLGNVYVYPTKLEGIGLTIAEALSVGLPVVTTDSPPMSEFVTDGDNGYLIPVSKFLGRPDGYYWAESIADTKELTRILQFIVNNPATIQSMSKSARKHAEEHLNWSLNAKLLCDIVESIIPDENRLERFYQLKQKVLGYSYQRRQDSCKITKKITTKLKAIMFEKLSS